MQIHLETERLLLRRFTADDADALVALHGDPEVMRYLSGGVPEPRELVVGATLPRILGYYDQYAEFGLWAAIERASGAFLGWFHLRPKDDANPDTVDLGYRLHRTAWGRGYATEASRALVRKGFANPAIRRITASAIGGNIASRRVMEKVGLTLVRTYRASRPDRFNGVEQEIVEYALDRADWEHLEAGHP
jgi:RimJ/RimL family protein N-acetyltransferase